MDEKQYINETSDHILKVGAYMILLITELQGRASNHDESKLSNPEKEGFIRVIPRLKNSTYGSQEHKDTLKEISPIIEHHNKVNRHHPEHFKNEIKDMNLIDIMEMICDWKASTLRHNDGNIERSIEMNQKRFGYSDDLKLILLNTVKLFRRK